jgi:alkanesulfonate monooxygenase SsuD/methylene tetrahydromethanopterin reductase-like flavin-dependent oxidoreductase (luciferase family)
MEIENLKFGLDTFGDTQHDDAGKPISAAQTIRNVVEQAVLADQLGLDYFSVGEHHRDDFAISSPDTVLAGIATRTKKIILGTGVTVLSSDDPVRVYQRFATIDALSNGRAEITAGRGSFIESFPLFGYELKDYGVLFEEKLELLVEILKNMRCRGQALLEHHLVTKRFTLRPNAARFHCEWALVELQSRLFAQLALMPNWQSQLSGEIPRDLLRSPIFTVPR